MASKLGMNKFKRTKLASKLLGAGLFLVPAGSIADNMFDARVSANSEFSDNANRTEQDQISERRDEYRLSVGTEYTNTLIEFQADYTASEHRFAEDSQQRRSLLEGRSSLLVGKPYHPVDLLLSHNRQSVLNEPDDVDLLRNTDERTIWSAVPTARWGFTRVDQLILQGNYSKIDYRLDERRNSERAGGSLSWQHDLSQTDQFTISAQQTQVSFDAAPDFDYDYIAYSAAYAAQLRQLSYNVELGYNETQPEIGEDFSGPSYRLNVSYTAAAQTFTLSSSQFITDSSRAGGNERDFRDFNPGDSTVDELDQLERTDFELGWRGEALCESCSLYARLIYQRDDYRTLDEDNQEHGVNLGLDYRLSQRSSIDISLQYREHNFDTETIRSDYSNTQLRAGYGYTFANDLGLRVYGSVNERDSDDELNGRGYEENIIGVGLNYSF